MKTIAIIGGGFCGAECARILDRKLPKEYELLLFDRKSHFEFTPSIHKILTDKNYENKIKVPYSKFLKRIKIITDKIIFAAKDKIKTEKSEYSFDFLVLSAGAHTPKPLIPKVYALKTIEDAKNIAEKIENANRILIIGGGLTGTEIAGELAAKTKKSVALIHGLDRLIERQPEKASKTAFDFLAGKNADIQLNSRAEINSGRLCINSKEKIDFDLAIWCTGIKPNTHFLKGFPVNEKGYLKIEPTFIVNGLKKVFAGGDLIDLPEEKSAQNAGHHGEIIAKNILNSINNKGLITYNPKARAMVISLGDWFGILASNNFVLSGIVPAVLKKAIEVSIVSRYRYLGFL